MTALPRITRTALANGKFRYEIDGRVHTKQSTRLYTHASLYVVDPTPANHSYEKGLDDRTPLPGHAAFLHARADLAMKGSSDAKRIGWPRVPGIIEIEEV